MEISRRTFVATGLTTMAAAYVGSWSSPCLGQTETGAEPAGEDGSKLWLRYPRIEADSLPRYVRAARRVLVEGSSQTSRVIREEVELALNGMLGDADRGVGPDLDNGAVLIGTTKNSATIRDMNLTADLAQLGPEGFTIRTIDVEGEEYHGDCLGGRNRGAVRHFPLAAADSNAVGAGESRRRRRSRRSCCGR